VIETVTYVGSLASFHLNEQLKPAQLVDDADKTSDESSQQVNDSALSEPAASSDCAYIPESTLDADTWVKAAEFVPGQLWQSVG